LKRKQVKDIITRMVAVVVASVMGTIGAGSIIGVELWKSASMAAILGVAIVLEGLARAYITDGKLRYLSEHLCLRHLLKQMLFVTLTRLPVTMILPTLPTYRSR
jgi:hypothetical protein